MIWNVFKYIPLRWTSIMITLDYSKQFNVGFRVYSCTIYCHSSASTRPRAFGASFAAPIKRTRALGLPSSFYPVCCGATAFCILSKTLMYRNSSYRYLLLLFSKIKSKWKNVGLLASFEVFYFFLFEQIKHFSYNYGTQT